MPAPRTTSKFPVNKYHIYGKSVIIFWSNLQLRVNMHQSTLRKSILAAYVRAVASRGGGGKGDSCSPWICWARQIKSVDGFVFFRLSYFDCSDLQLLLFAIFISYSRSIFWRHISWQVSTIVFQSLQIWKFSGGRYPHTPLQGSCLRHSQ